MQEEKNLNLHDYKDYDLGKTTHTFELLNNKKFNNEKVTFDSNFDSGNCKSVT